MSTLNQFVGIGTSLTINNLTACIETTFDTTAPLGSRPHGAGGFLLCKASSNAWIVSPRCAEVERSWYNRNHANTLAQSCTSYPGWFVPTCGQLMNPGYTCRQYWDLFSSSNYYWSSTEYDAPYAWSVCVFNGGAITSTKNGYRYVRAFRCVTY